MLVEKSSTSPTIERIHIIRDQIIEATKLDPIPKISSKLSYSLRLHYECPAKSWEQFEEAHGLPITTG